VLNGVDRREIQTMSECPYDPNVSWLPIGSNDHAKQNLPPKPIPASFFCVLWIWV
jgi:hypothetical protein